jgi:hypothetical protein
MNENNGARFKEAGYDDCPHMKSFWESSPSARGAAEGPSDHLEGFLK